MSRLSRRALGACLLFSSWSAEARTYSATASTLKAVFAIVKSGDTIVLTGNIPGAVLQNRSFTKPVILDAKAAVFTNTLKIYSVTGLTVLGGHFGSATAAVNGVNVLGGGRITFTSPVVVGNRTSSHGIDFSRTTSVTVTGGTFTGLRSGISLTSVTGGTLSNNKSLASTSDGFDIAASHRISVTGNSCSGTVISAGAHPDCVQLWSIPGQPPTSDITIRGNTAVGNTQGFSLFDHAQGGGLRIYILNNQADITYTQAIACYQCVDSIFTGNVISTQPGAQWSARMSIIGGSNNRIANNSVAPFVRASLSPGLLVPGGFDAAKADLALADTVFTNAPGTAPASDPAILSRLGPASEAGAFGGEVPEPASWALLVVGFGLVGTVFRKRRRSVVAA